MNIDRYPGHRHPTLSINETVQRNRMVTERMDIENAFAKSNTHPSGIAPTPSRTLLTHKTKNRFYSTTKNMITVSPGTQADNPIRKYEIRQAFSPKATAWRCASSEPSREHATMPVCKRRCHTLPRRMHGCDEQICARGCAMPA